MTNLKCSNKQCFLCKGTGVEERPDLIFRHCKKCSGSGFTRGYLNDTETQVSSDIISLDLLAELR
jgi:DnaJ-class molecular chaperone